MQKRKIYSRIIIVLLSTLMVIFLLWTPNPYKIERKRDFVSVDISFADKLNHKIRFSIMSQLSEASHRALVSEMISVDTQGKMGREISELNLDETDVMIVILKEWGDSKKLSNFPGFEEIVKSLESEREDVYKKSFFLYLDHNRLFLLQVYNLKAWPTVNIRCLARDIVLEVTSTNPTEKAVNALCQ